MIKLKLVKLFLERREFNIESLLKRVREVTKEDREKLPRCSFSQLSLLEQCAYRYKNKYIDKKYSNKSTLPLELGSIAHKVMETKGNYILENKPVDYEYLEGMMLYGCEDTDKSKTFLPGVEDIKRRYTPLYYQADTNGITYQEKIELFLTSVIRTRMSETEDWRIKGNEIEFEYVYDDRIIMHGFIDRIDENQTKDLRVVDYKTSKNIFPVEKVKTAMQMFIYDLGCYLMFGRIPTQHVFDFIFIDKLQSEKDGVCSAGYLKRGFRKLDNWLDKKDALLKDEIYPPSPTPLCYWCEYSCNTPNSDPLLNHWCQYYSLWTPDNKTYVVNKKFVPDKNNGKNIGATRHFVF